MTLTGPMRNSSPQMRNLDYSHSSEGATSLFGPMSAILAELRAGQGISNNASLMAPPISVHTVGQQVQRPNSIEIKKSLEENLFDTLASFKIKTSSIAMHLDEEWRQRFFSQLDSLLSGDSWEREDKPPSLASFTTLLRMLLMLAPVRRPGLGATSDGDLIAAWTVGADRLTIQCLPNDRVKWVLSCDLGGARESAAGRSNLLNLTDIISPYRPDRWFRAHRVP
jgi:hypothetical protein